MVLDFKERPIIVISKNTKEKLDALKNSVLPKDTNLYFKGYSIKSISFYKLDGSIKDNFTPLMLPLLM